MTGARRGMTLVELLVSLALLGMIAVLVSMMWGQLRRWGEGSEAAFAALRPQRVHMMLERQWGARAEGGEEQLLGRVSGDRSTLVFTTYRPVVHVAWPFVEATYRVEPVDLGRPDGLVRVVYSERRLGPTLETVASGEVDEIVLLDDCRVASMGFRARRAVEGGDGSEYEEVWLDALDESAVEEMEPLYVEFSAEQRGEVIGWVGVLTALR